MENKRFNPNPSPRSRRIHHIPPCEESHSQWMETHCYKCQDIRNEDVQKEMLFEMRRANELKEIELELGPKQQQEPRYTPPPLPDPKPLIQRRGA
jgi:hypothetical protein